MKIDLLSELASGSISMDEAYDLRDEAVDAANEGGRPWADALGFSRQEGKAYLHGATLKQLARARKEGWPSTCCRCDLPINIPEDYWLFVHREDDQPAIKHVTCPDGATGLGRCAEIE